METTQTRLDVLGPSECLRRLVEQPVKVGRVGFMALGYPVILPVNYRVDRDTVVFRTGAGSKLDAATAGSPLAFEVDEFDPTWQEGWSVLVQGRATVVVAPAELARLRQLGLEPWSPQEAGRYIRLRPERLTGRRIV